MILWWTVSYLQRFSKIQTKMTLSVNGCTMYSWGQLLVKFPILLFHWSTHNIQSPSSLSIYKPAWKPATWGLKSCEEVILDQLKSFLGFNYKLFVLVLPHWYSKTVILLFNYNGTVLCIRPNCCNYLFSFHNNHFLYSTADPDVQVDWGVCL